MSVKGYKTFMSVKSFALFFFFTKRVVAREKMCEVERTRLWRSVKAVDSRLLISLAHSDLLVHNETKL